MIDVQAHLDKLRTELEVAATMLSLAVKDACPAGDQGEHRPVQHPDGKRPWCPHCGRTELGDVIPGTDGKPPTTGRWERPARAGTEPIAG